MRLYLSSFRIGERGAELAAMVGRGPMAVVMNAVDGDAEEERAEKLAGEHERLGELGIATEELDLRDFDLDPSGLRAAAARFPAWWVRGGNVFVLRRALRRSGADDLIVELLTDDRVVYAGYSAGPCMLSPSLRGIDLVDDPSLVTHLYGDEPIWEGLGLLDYAFVPHYRSDHPESAAVDDVVAYYSERGLPYRTVRDGEAIVVGG
ncbi:MAG TPA: Type 1 glutamine amidotransferase-like domain-containing protein [Acidimicrobiales bacterium]|nr:Type 1 glutamine amidotransferase-like domain-containing protein [Acidimicrobiales bacterium]